MLKPFIAKLMMRKDLSQEEAFEAMEIIMTGQATPAQIGSYLTALRLKGETMAEITGSASAMRSVAIQIELDVDGAVIDTAGTGGDGTHSINLSTAAAFVIAGAGYTVAKHGNRAASSKSGSADVLEALGVKIDLQPEDVKTCIENVGIGFMFAPLFHPAMKHAIGPRREIGQRTIFNILGPLTNPANTSHQLIGVFDPELTHVMAEVLGELGVKGAMVVHGHVGMDELTTDGVSQVSELRDGKVTAYEFDPAEFGLRAASKGDLQGGTPDENAAALVAILKGEDTSSRSDVVLLNAAAAIATLKGSMEDGLSEARQSLESGAALEKMNALIAESQQIGERATAQA